MVSYESILGISANDVRLSVCPPPQYLENDPTSVVAGYDWFRVAGSILAFLPGAGFRVFFWNPAKVRLGIFSQKNYEDKQKGFNNQVT